MKKLLLATALAVVACSPAAADGLTTLGLDDPEVIAPLRPDWTGFYGGLSYGRVSTVTDSTKCVDQTKSAKPCVDVVTSTETSEDVIGGFVGYRHNVSLVVLGVEAGRFGDLTSLEAQAGLDFTNVLAYSFVGAGSLDGEDGTVYGAGVDVALGKSLFVGVKHTIGNFDAEYDVTTARVGLKF